MRLRHQISGRNRSAFSETKHPSNTHLLLTSMTARQLTRGVFTRSQPWSQLHLHHSHLGVSVHSAKPPCTARQLHLTTLRTRKPLFLLSFRRAKKTGTTEARWLNNQSVQHCEKLGCALVGFMFKTKRSNIGFILSLKFTSMVNRTGTSSADTNKDANNYSGMRFAHPSLFMWRT